jgi:hypothetical protein
MIKKLLLILGLCLIVVILYQFYIIEYDRSMYNDLRQKAIADLETRNVNYNEEIVNEVTSAYWKKEAENNLRATKLRKFTDSITEEEKNSLLKHLRYQTIEENPDKIFEISTIKEGYSILTYTNERIFGLTSVRQVNFSKNYFIIIISSFLLVVTIIFWFIANRNKSEQE